MQVRSWSSRLTKASRVDSSSMETLHPCCAGLSIASSSTSPPSRTVRSRAGLSARSRSDSESIIGKSVRLLTFWKMKSHVAAVCCLHPLHGAHQCPQLQGSESLLAARWHRHSSSPSRSSRSCPQLSAQRGGLSQRRRVRLEPELGYGGEGTVGWNTSRRTWRRPRRDEGEEAHV